MSRSQARELVRQAQAAEIAGEAARAIDLLGRAAQMHLDCGESARAANLWRHCLRLAPHRSDLRALAEQAESSQEKPAGERETALEVVRRGPTPADPAVDCWCSFCCRPRAEAGPMIAGPAGAYICRSCIGAAADLSGTAIATPAEGDPPDVPPPRRGIEPGKASPPEAAEEEFIEAAVVLAKELGWGLAELRTLSRAERDRALRALERLRARKRPRRGR